MEIEIEIEIEGERMRREERGEKPEMTETANNIGKGKKQKKIF